MFLKATVLTLMTVLALSSPHDDKSGNSAASNPYTNPYGSSNQYEMNERTATIIFIVYAIGFLVVAGINIFLCMKCYNKRAVSKRIK
jgi:hypothetical protein